MAEMDVAVVAADQTVWSGQASLVLARTLEGELAVMPGHTPVMGILSAGEVRVTPTDGTAFSAEVDGGFLSVENNRVLIVAETVEVDGKK